MTSKHDDEFPGHNSDVTTPTLPPARLVPPFDGSELKDLPTDERYVASLGLATEDVPTLAGEDKEELQGTTAGDRLLQEAALWLVPVLAVAAIYFGPPKGWADDIVNLGITAIMAMMLFGGAIACVYTLLQRVWSKVR